MEKSYKERLDLYKKNRNRANKFASIFTTKAPQKSRRNKLHSVTFYSKIVDDNAYIRSIDANLIKKDEEKKVSSFISHLSPNRTLTEFRPFFNPKLEINHFFKEFWEEISKMMETVLKDKKGGQMN